jgi:ribokinase
LREGGVDLSLVREAKGPTGVALILVEQSGENVIAVVPGANGTVTEADAAPVDFVPGDVLVLQLEVPILAIDAVARRARAAGARVLLNFAPYRADALHLLPHATHLIVNETECALIAEALGLAAATTAEQAAALAARYESTAIATLGRDGVVACEADRTETAPALPIAAVDTVGAGDTFCGYLAAGLSEGMALPTTLGLAAAAASLACTKAGAQPPVPVRAEVEQAIRSIR